MTLSKEPATIITLLTGLATEIIGLLVAFGIDVSDAQRTSIIGTLTALCVLIVALGPIIRNYVYSPHSTEQLVNRAFMADPTVDDKPEVK